MAKTRAADAATTLALAPEGGLAAAEARVEMLDQLVEETFKALRAERRGGLPSEEELHAEVSRAEGDLERTRAELSHEKARAKAKKREIDEWKRWFDALSAAERPAGVARLQSEIGWRAKELDHLTRHVGELVQAVTAAELRVETLRARLVARETGCMTGPLEADPRLVAVRTACDEARAALERLRKS